MPTAATMSQIDRPGFTSVLENLFRQHSQFVYKTACVVTGTPQDAEDVLQTIFLRLTRRTVPPSFYKNPDRYLYRAAINVSLNVIRFRRRQVLIGDFQSFDIPKTSVNPKVEATIQRLHRAISTLSPRTVEILILRYVHDYTEPEIGRLLGVSRGTIAVTLFRSRNRLRKLLTASGENR